MTLLITYHSDTGNTEKVAQAIYEEARKTHVVDLVKIPGIDSTQLENCELLFVGAPCHMGDLSNTCKEFLQTLSATISCKIAGFITHAASLYHEDDYKKCFKSLESMCDDKGLQFLGCFNCRGFLNPHIHEMVKKAKNIGDGEWNKRVEEMRGHPDLEDLAKAQAFARSIILRQ